MTTDPESRYSRPYLDTSVHIADVQNEPGREISTRILSLAEQGNLTIIASTFVIAELVYATSGMGYIAPEEDVVIQRRFLNSWTQTIDLTVPIAREARRIAREHGLKPPDAVHVATALQADADVFLSWDDHLLGRTIQGLACRQPYLVG